MKNNKARWESKLTMRNLGFPLHNLLDILHSVLFSNDSIANYLYILNMKNKI